MMNDCLANTKNSTGLFDRFFALSDDVCTAPYPGQPSNDSPSYENSYVPDYLINNDSPQDYSSNSTGSGATKTAKTTTKIKTTNDITSGNSSPSNGNFISKNIKWFIGGGIGLLGLMFFLSDHKNKDKR
jgi:hypothetical protein